MIVILNCTLFSQIPKKYCTIIEVSIEKFCEENHGFGHHMLSAIMLGNESQRKKLASIFGDENTTVALDFETLIEQSMYKFDEDIEAYLEDKIL